MKATVGCPCGKSNAFVSPKEGFKIARLLRYCSGICSSGLLDAELDGTSCLGIGVTRSDSSVASVPDSDSKGTPP